MEDKVVDYYQKLQQSPSMHQFKKILKNRKYMMKSIKTKTPTLQRGPIKGKL
jgi:hypothetical protein